MPTLEINGRRVQVDDSFLKMSPDEQNATVDEIASSMPAASAEPAPAEKSLGEKWRSETITGRIWQGLEDGAKNVGDLLSGRKPVMDPVTNRPSDEAVRFGWDVGSLATPTTPAMRIAGRTPTFIGRNGVPEAPPVAPPAAPAVNPTVAAGAKVGVEVPRFLATESRTVRGTAEAMKQSPMGGATIEKAADKFLVDTGEAVQRTASKAASGSESLARADVGAKFRAAISEAVDKADEAASAAYKSLRGEIDPAKAANVTEDVAPTLNSIMKARQAAGEGSKLGGELANIEELMTRPEGVTFSGLQRARSQLNRAINWDARNGGFASGDLKQAKSALDKALENTVRQTAKSNPDRAVQIFKAADKRFASTAANNKVLSDLLRTNADEQLVEKVVRMGSEKAGGNIRQLQFLKQQVAPEAWDDFAGMVINRLGTNKAGEFTGETFRNSWQAISPAAKSLMFRDKDVREALEAIAELAKRAADANKYRSPSGRSIATAATGAALYADPVTTIAAALGSQAVAKVLAKPATARAVKETAKAAIKSPPGSVTYDRATKQLQAIITRELAMASPANDLVGTLRGAAEDGGDNQPPRVRQY